MSQQASTRLFQPLAIYFKHAAPESITAHERFFGCPVHFDSDKDALLVSSVTLVAPNQLGDATIAEFFDTHLEQVISKLDNDSGLEKQVRIQIFQQLSEGVPVISDIAGRLGMSGRTLQRRLSEKGQSFQALVDELRRQLAERLLRQTDYSLMDVAFLTGFFEQSAFNRAFKRWAGQTPRSFRIGAQS
jgi:AraC-like DNA-binding protein